MKSTLLLLVLTLSFTGAYADSTWYHPNPWWKVARGNTSITKNAFEYRQALPQFGYPHRWTGSSWDASDWAKWAEHNMISAPHRLVGHSWQVFIQQNAEILKKNPQFLAEVKGKRLGYGKTSKLCVSNIQLQRAFVKNALERFTKQADFDGYISVEPSDGADHCECKECQNMGSISNRVFYLANLAARAIGNKYPKGGVNLYAYYLHADTPSIRLEPNVHVTVVPSGFQTTYDGDVLMYLWKEKTDNLSYYDYIAIPQWKGELPRINIKNYVRRIEIAKKLGYQGFWHEVGLSLPATISIQLMSQLWRDPSLSWQEVFDNFISDCFPNAKVPMTRLFDRWFNEWDEDKEIMMAYDDISEAETNQLTIDEKRRLTDIKAYTYYIVAYQKWRRNETSKTTQRFFTDVFHIANRQVINTSALFQLFGSKIKESSIRQHYNILANKNWQWMNTWSDKQIGDNLSNYYRHNLQEIAKIKKAANSKPISNKNTLTFKYANTILIEGNGKEIIMSIKSTDFAISRDGKQYISLISEQGDLIFNYLCPLEKNIRFQSKKGVIYRFAAKQIFSSTLTINTPDVKVSVE